MNIFLTNDDGYQSSGLQIFCSKLAELGHCVYIVAPDGQRLCFDECKIVDDDTVCIVGSCRLDVEENDCDVVYLDEGYIAVTPINVSRTDNTAIDMIKDLEI